MRIPFDHTPTLSPTLLVVLYAHEVYMFERDECVSKSIWLSAELSAQKFDVPSEAVYFICQTMGGETWDSFNQPQAFGCMNIDETI